MSVRSDSPCRYVKPTPGQPRSKRNASAEGLTVSPVATDQWPGDPAVTGWAAAARAADTVRASAGTAAEVRVISNLRRSKKRAHSNHHDFESPRPSLPLSAWM